MSGPQLPEKAYLAALRHIPNLGVKGLIQACDALGSPEGVWKASAIHLEASWLSPEIKGKLLSGRRMVDPYALWERLHSLGVTVLAPADPGYPDLLKEISDPPVVLFVLGTLTAPAPPRVAVVGTRRSTSYGKKVANQLSRDLAASGVEVVSGMARGIDSWAHRGCLEAGGKTLAVIGTGLDVVYPRENGSLMREIASCGAVLSEFPLGTHPAPGNFPARNRIISGLSMGTLVVEAGQKSGALITADLALEQGREVFAVPGPITSPVSFGSNLLLQQGARLVAGVEDILDEFGLRGQLTLFNRKPAPPGVKSPAAAKLLGFLEREPRLFDDLVRETGLSAREVAVALSLLEVHGMIERRGSTYACKD